MGQAFNTLATGNLNPAGSITGNSNHYGSLLRVSSFLAQL